MKIDNSEIRLSQNNTKINDFSVGAMNREPFDLFDDDERGFDYEVLLSPINFDADAAETIAARESLRPAVVVNMSIRPLTHNLNFGGHQVAVNGEKSLMKSIAVQVTHSKLTRG